MFGTIMTYLILALVLYYVGMIAYDTFVQKNKESENNEQEEEIDISGEANSFAVTHISRKPTIVQPVLSSPDQIEEEEDEIEPEVSEQEELKVTDENIDELLSVLGAIPDEIRFAEGNPTNFREPIMTGFMSPDELVGMVQEKAKEGNSDMGDIIAECQNAA